MNSFRGKESEEDDQPGGQNIGQVFKLECYLFFFFCKLESDSFSNVHHAKVFFVMRLLGEGCAPRASSFSRVAFVGNRQRGNKRGEKGSSFLH